MTSVSTAVECQSCTAPVDEQTWYVSCCAGIIEEIPSYRVSTITNIMTRMNTIIRLSSADESFGQTISPSHGAKYTEPETSDSGKTWVIKKITIPVVQPSNL